MENICRQQNKHDSKIKICFGEGLRENTVGKGKKYWSQHFFPFSQCFQETYSLELVLCGNVLNKKDYHTIIFIWGIQFKPQQTKVFKTGSCGFPPLRSGLWE